MKFFATAVTLLTTAGSFASAFHQSLNARDVAFLDSAFSVVRREAYEAAYNDAMEAMDHVLSARFVEDDEFQTVSIRSPFPDPADEYAFQVLERRGRELEYLRNIDTSAVTGSFPKNSWNRMHGDTKSGTDGAYHIETGLFSDKPKARLLASGVKGSAAVLKEITIPRAQLGCAVHNLRVAYGGPTPPAGCK